MRQAHLIVALAGVIIVAVLAVHASAMYDPGLGCFLQRDPALDADLMRIRGGAPMPLQLFITRDVSPQHATFQGIGVVHGGGRYARPQHAAQYADGMDLYQYVRSAPTVQLDPTGLGATQTGNDLVECRATYLVCIGNAGVDLLARARCAAAWATCAQDAIPPFDPLPDSSPECDKYGCKDSYAGANARCFCKCAGNSPWSQYVRGCLRQLYNQGVDPDLAHRTCYNMGDVLSRGEMPTGTLAYCYIKCLVVQAAQ
jgi:hypothetical protein